MDIESILWTFGIFVVIWYIFPRLIYCTKKNLATLDLPKETEKLICFRKTNKKWISTFFDARKRVKIYWEKHIRKKERRWKTNFCDFEIVNFLSIQILPLGIDFVSPCRRVARYSLVKYTKTEKIHKIYKMTTTYNKSICTKWRRIIFNSKAFTDMPN
jgi:hypothetical protein